MSNVFEIGDKRGRKIRLTKERWSHITHPSSLHPYMTNYLEEIKQTILSPDLVLPQKFDNSKANYYRYIKNKKRYLLVGVKYLNGEGFITTAFMVRNILKK